MTVTQKRVFSAVFLIATGAVAMFLGAVLSSAGIERFLLGRATGALSWGPGLFRGLLAFHGLVLIGCGADRLHPRPAAPSADGEVAVHPRTPWIVWTLMGLLVCGALALRLYRLNSDLWIDEVFTLVDFVRPSVGQVLTSFPSQNQHMLYSLMAKAAMAVWGESAWTLRLPAVLLGVLSIPALFLLARWLVGAWQALGACALLTLSYHHIWFSQNGRGYTGVLFFATLSTWLWLKALPERRWTLWSAYIAAIALGSWIHLTMALVAAAHGLSYLGLLIFGSRREDGRRQLKGVVLGRWWMPLAALTLCGTLTLQMYALALPDFLNHGLKEVSLKSEWTSVWWLVAETVRGLGLGYLGWAPVLAGGIVLAAGWISIFRRHWAAALVMAIPPVAICVFMAIQAHNLWPRFMFFSAGFVILAVVHGVVQVVRWGSSLLPFARRSGLESAVAALAVILVILVSAMMVPRNYTLPKQDYTGARDFVKARLETSASAVAVGLAGEMYERYYEPHWGHPRSGPALEAMVRERSTVWLVYTMPIHMRVYHPDIWGTIERNFELVKVFPGTLGGGEVYVCRAKTRWFEIQ